MVDSEIPDIAGLTLEPIVAQTKTHQIYEHLKDSAFPKKLERSRTECSDKSVCENPLLLRSSPILQDTLSTGYSELNENAFENPSD